MNELTIRKATRQGIVPLIGINGKSGTGKTKSALLLMRGIIGSKGRLVCVDTEFRRSEEYADEVPGGFDVIQLDPPYSPRRYHEALELAVKHADGVVVDSISHEWNGDGGVLQAIDEWLDAKCGDDYGKRDRMKFMAWNSTAPREHAVLVSYMTRYPIPLIVCFRAKDKVIIGKEEDEKTGRQKTVVSTDRDVPVQRGDLIWELKLVLETNKLEENGNDMGGGYFTVRKRGIDSLCAAVCAAGNRISVAHGEIIAKWCNAPSATPATAAAPAVSAPKNTIAAAKKRLWDMTVVIHNGNKATLVEWLKFIELYTKPLEELTEPEIEELINKVATALPKA